MAYLIDCDPTGTNPYEGQKIAIIYKPTTSDKWVKEVGIVDENGMLNITTLLDTNQQYWIGRCFVSEIKTFPLKQKVSLNRKGRVSRIDIYMEASQDGTVTISDEANVPSVQAIAYDDDELFTGRKQVAIGGTYADEIQLDILTDSENPFNILAIEPKYEQYEA